MAVNKRFQQRFCTENACRFLLKTKLLHYLIYCRLSRFLPPTTAPRSNYDNQANLQHLAPTAPTPPTKETANNVLQPSNRIPALQPPTPTFLSNAQSNYQLWSIKAVVKFTPWNSLSTSCPPATSATSSPPSTHPEPNRPGWANSFSG